MKKFMRTRPAPPALATANGVANGTGVGLALRHEDLQSTLSRVRAGGPLWEDPEFPLTARALGDARLAKLKWVRPHEVCANPRFMGDVAVDAGLPEDQVEPESDEVMMTRWCSGAGERCEAGEQSAHAPCLRVAASALALTPRLLARAVPPHSFRTGYCGRFRFRLWVFGTWREVTVDDRLPARAAVLTDFTLPLLEKAYAKLHGGYGALRSDSVSRALQALTGGVLQSFAPPRQPRALLLRVLGAALPRSTLLVASSARAAHRPGPLPAHSYSVTGLARLPATGDSHADPDNTYASVSGAETVLVRLRAGCTRGVWGSPWARGGARWRALPPPDRDLLDRRTPDPTVFWVSFSEFARVFDRLELVHVGPDDWLAERALQSRRPWRAVLARRRWRRGASAGGPPGAPTAPANPQFSVAVPRAAADTHVVVSVTQQYSPRAPARLPAVGFAVFELPPTAPPRRAHLTARALAGLRALDVTHESRAREVVTFFTLPPGQYLVMPYMQRPHAEAAFLLRILTDDHTDVWEINDDNVIIRDIAAEFAEEGYPLPVEVQKVVSKFLEKQDMEEIEAEGLRTVLVRVWRWVLPARPSRELCRALLMLRDAGASGRMPARALPALLALLGYWRAALRRAAPTRCGGASAYQLRALLYACGVSVSNKVLECLVLRFARGTELPPEACILALARLHLAHERYRTLDAKMKSNPLSLEEMILMTIYS